MLSIQPLSPFSARFSARSSARSKERFVLDYDSPGRVDLVVRFPETGDRPDVKKVELWARQVAEEFFTRYHYPVTLSEMSDLIKVSKVNFPPIIATLSPKNRKRIQRFLQGLDLSSGGAFEMEFLSPLGVQVVKEPYAQMVFPLFTGDLKRLYYKLFNRFQRIESRLHRLTHHRPASTETEFTKEPSKSDIKEYLGVPKKESEITEADRKKIRQLREARERVAQQRGELLKVIPSGQIVLTTAGPRNDLLLKFRKRVRRPQ